jgi:hypothetical protein
MDPDKSASRHPVCSVEGHGPLEYFKGADAYACMRCDEWREQRCDDEACPYCMKRPAHPSEVEAP